MIDYRELLVKYLRHVGREEGCSFIPSFGIDDEFTEEEVYELDAIDDEVTWMAQQWQAFCDAINGPKSPQDMFYWVNLSDGRTLVMQHNAT